MKKIITLYLLLITSAFALNLSDRYQSFGGDVLLASGDLEGTGFGLNVNFKLGESDFVTNASFSYMSYDEYLGTDISSLDPEVYTISLGLGYVFEISESLHLVPTLGYAYAEFGVLGYEAATLDGLSYGAILRYKIASELILNLTIMDASGKLNSSFSELDNLTADSTAYSAGLEYALSDVSLVTVGWATDRYESDAISLGMRFAF